MVMSLITGAILGFELWMFLLISRLYDGSIWSIILMIIFGTPLILLLGKYINWMQYLEKDSALKKEE